MNKHPYDIQDEHEAIRIAIRRVADVLGKTPTQKEYKTERNSNEPSLEQITYRLGNWSNAVKQAGLEPNPFQVPPRQPEITKQQLAEEFIRVANKLNCVPSMNQFRANACYSWTPYKTNWGAWKQAVNSIIDEYHEKFNFDIKQSKSKKKIPGKKRLRFECPILYEPRNEYETIALFCFLAEELGFKIKSIQSDFPDALLVKDNEDIKVEFEFLSSNYIQHCHPLDFDGAVICWREDVELQGIETISLEEYIRRKA